MKYLVIAMLALVACEDEAAETADGVAAKAQCKAVLTHVVQITPQGQGKDSTQVVDALPIEDVQACVATEPEIRACMLAATDVAGVKKCIPSDDVLACMRTAAKAKKAAHENAKDADAATIDKPFDEIREKCWHGDAKAADKLVTE